MSSPSKKSPSIETFLAISCRRQLVDEKNAFIDFFKSTPIDANNEAEILSLWNIVSHKISDLASPSSRIEHDDAAVSCEKEAPWFEILNFCEASASIISAFLWPSDENPRIRNAVNAQCGSELTDLVTLGLLGPAVDAWENLAFVCRPMPSIDNHDDYLYHDALFQNTLCTGCYTLSEIFRYVHCILLGVMRDTYSCSHYSVAVVRTITSFVEFIAMFNASVTKLNSELIRKLRVVLDLIYDMLNGIRTSEYRNLMKILLLGQDSGQDIISKVFVPAIASRSANNENPHAIAMWAFWFVTLIAGSAHDVHEQILMSLSSEKAIDALVSCIACDQLPSTYTCPSNWYYLVLHLCNPHEPHSTASTEMINQRQAAAVAARNALFRHPLLLAALRSMLLQIRFKPALIETVFCSILMGAASEVEGMNMFRRFRMVGSQESDLNDGNDDDDEEWDEFGYGIEKPDPEEVERDTFSEHVPEEGARYKNLIPPFLMPKPSNEDWERVRNEVDGCTSLRPSLLKVFEGPYFQKLLADFRTSCFDNNSKNESTQNEQVGAMLVMENIRVDSLKS